MPTRTLIGVAPKVRVWIESRVLLHDFRADRSPRAPRIDRLVEIYQNGVVLRLAQKGAEDAADDRNAEDDGEQIKRVADAVAQAQYFAGSATTGRRR